MALTLIYLSFLASHSDVRSARLTLLLPGEDELWVVKAKIVGKF